MHPETMSLICDIISLLKGVTTLKKIIKYILIGFVGLMVLGAIMGGSDNDKSGNQVSETQKETEKPKETLKVEILPFIKDFDENQLAAEEKYKDKYIEFSGYIKNISEDITGSPFLSIYPNTDQYYYGTYIQCFFEEKSDLISLKNGQKVSIQGKFSSQTLGIIVVKDCKVIVQ